MSTNSTVIDISEARQRAAMRKNSGHRRRPPWKSDIITFCAYARMVRAEHDAECARICFEQLERGITVAWWQGPDDIRERVHENNRKWDLYIGLCAHLAMLPASTRNEARVKRDTIGKGWLSPDNTLARDPKPGTLGESFANMRLGCLADDHLFPPSLKLARGSMKKGG